MGSLQVTRRQVLPGSFPIIMGAQDAMPIGCTAIKPVERHGLEAVKWFLYDKDTGAIIGRTPKSWALITIFYIIYYSCLAAFWVLCLYIFFQFIDNDQPRWQQENSLIGRSPALGVRPGQDWDSIESSIILFNYERESDEVAVPGYGGWVKRADEFLKPYNNNSIPNAKDCSRDAANFEEGEFCRFPIASIGNCAKGKHGFDSNSPCLILKLNRIYGLEPEYYTAEDAADFPDDMPMTLQNKIKASGEKKVWVSCQGENPADKEGYESFEYFPRDAAFPATYFPFLNQEDYQSPLVAVKLNNVNPGQLLHIECRAWAKNIKYNRRDRVGIVRFELIAHDEKSANQVNELA